MPILDPRTLSVARTLLILAVVAAFIYGARHTLIAFLMAIFFAYLVSPLVSRVERWQRISRGSRTLAIAEVYAILALIVTGLALGIGPHIAADGRQLISAAPSLLDKLGSGEIVHKIGFTRGWSYQTQLRAEQFLAQHKDAVLPWIKQFGIQVGALVAQMFWILLIPILAIPFLKDAPEIVEATFSALRLRPQARTFAEVVLQDVNSMAASFIRAQLIFATLAIVAYTAVLVASRVQYGIVLALVAGALEFIPMVGPAVGAALILTVAFLTGFHHLILLVVFLGCWRLAQDYFNSPRLMHENVHLNPFVVIFAVLAGGEIAGFLGVFLSIPTAATLQIVWRSWRAFSERDIAYKEALRKSRSKAA
jgi:predicted PurR-regulated permease PerM